METRIVRRHGGGRGFLAPLAIGTILPIATAGGAQVEPKSVTCLLDSIREAQASSVLLDSLPPPQVTVDLDALPAETTLDGGRTRVWRLDTAVARAPDGTPIDPRISVGGADATAEVSHELQPSRATVFFKDHPAFQGARLWTYANGETFVVVSEEATTTFELPLPATPARFSITGRVLGPNDDPHDTELRPPRVTVRAGDALLGEVDLLAQPVELAVDLPAGTGSTRISLEVARVFPDRGLAHMAALRAFTVEARDGRDRLRVDAPAGVRGLAASYPAAPPPPVQLLFSSDEVRKPPKEQVGVADFLPGRVGLVMSEPQALELLVGDEPVGRSEERGYEVVFDTTALGQRRVTLRCAKGLKGSYWLVQPRSLYLGLRDADASLREPVSCVRGLEEPGGHPLVRHFTAMSDTRRSLLAPVGSEVALPVSLAPGDVLEYAVASAWLSEVMLPRGKLGVALALATPDGRRFELGTETLLTQRQTPWEARKVRPPEGFAGSGRLLIRTFATGLSPFASSDALIAFAEPRVVHPHGPRRPNVLVYLVDTLRADHCTPWGYARETTPRLAELATEGILFERAYAQAPWTRPSVATLFTGWLPTFHDAGRVTGLAPQIVTLAELMHDAGYATAGFIANAHVHGGSLNFEQGFSQFEAVEKRTRRGDTRADEVSKSALRWLQEHRGEPSFLYLHTIDPHAPYDPPTATRGTWSSEYVGRITSRMTNARVLRNLAERAPLPASDLQHVIDLYDEEILSNDREFAALCAELKAAGTWDDTIVVVLSDHGEEFYEHEGFGHGTVLWQELLHVPVIVKPDRREGDSLGRRVKERIRVMDLAPTLLERVGLGSAAARTMGTSLAAALSGGDVPELPVVAEEFPDKRTLIQGSLKWIEYGPRTRKPRAWLFDLEKDPRERDDLSARFPEIVARMRERLDGIYLDYESRGFVRQHGIVEHLGALDREALRNLGYVQGGEDDDGGGAARGGGR